MNIIFRVDSCSEIGTGHVMRCLTLAERLKQQGATISFICRRLPSNLNHLIRTNGFNVLEIPSWLNSDKEGFLEWFAINWEHDAESTAALIDTGIPIDLLIIDHYGIDIKWESILRGKVKKMMVIDDLANRKHDCDVLLDQNFHLNYHNRYEHLIPQGCKLLLGPQYALLRDEFIKMAGRLRTRDGCIKKILVFFGGTDPTNETMKTIAALSKMNRYLFQVDVIAGNTNQNKDLIEAFCLENNNFTFHHQVNNISELMNEADLAIGAGGSTTWERCFVGLRALTLIIAENQKEVTEAVSFVGAAINLGESNTVTEKSIIETIVGLLAKPTQVISMSDNSKKIVNPETLISHQLIHLLIPPDKGKN